MHILSTQKYKVDTYYNLEVVSITHQSIQNYPSIHKGYILHFSVSDNTLQDLADDFQFSLAHSWKISSPGPLEKLEQDLEKFKHTFVEMKNYFAEFVDQFGYLVLFIVQGVDGYELIISSDSFGIDQVVPLIYSYSES